MSAWVLLNEKKSDLPETPETGKKGKKYFLTLGPRKRTTAFGYFVCQRPFRAALFLLDYKLFPTTLISTHLWVLLTSDLSLFQKKTGKLTRQIIHPYH